MPMCGLLFLQNESHCYYHGHVRGDSESTVALSTCAGLR